MKLNKTNLLAAFFAATLVVAGTTSQAQESTTPSTVTPPSGGNGGPKNHGPNLDMLAQQLSLTDDQKSKIKAAMDDQRQKVQALMADQSLSKEDRRSQAQQLRQDFMTQLKGILTPEQFSKFQHMMAHHHSHGTPGGNAPTNTPAAAH